MNQKGHIDGSQSGFFESLDESGVSDGKWSYVEEIHTSSVGMTRVLKARRYGKVFALKCLKPEIATDPLVQSLLHKEFEIGISLNHPNVVSTQDFVEVAGLGRCIVMEWIDGVTLDVYLQSHKLKKHSAYYIALELLDAVEYIHKHQVVHRDLKPQNVMLTTMGNQVKLLDFGLSDGANYTAFKQPAGTPGYIAPELLSGESNGDERSDIYSLGMILKEFHPSLAKVACRCTAENPADRYQSISQVRQGLARKKRWWLRDVALLFAVISIASAVWFFRLSKNVTEVEVASVPADTAPSVVGVEDTSRVKSSITNITLATPTKPKAESNTQSTGVVNELKSQVQTEEKNKNTSSAEREAFIKESEKKPNNTDHQFSRINESQPISQHADVGSYKWCESIFLPIWESQTTGIDVETMSKSKRLYIIESVTIEFKEACERDFNITYSDKDRDYWYLHSEMERNMRSVINRYSKLR